MSGPLTVIKKRAIQFQKLLKDLHKRDGESKTCESTGPETQKRQQLCHGSVIHRCKLSFHFPYLWYDQEETYAHTVVQEKYTYTDSSLRRDMKLTTSVHSHVPASNANNALVHIVAGQENSPLSSCYSMCQEKPSTYVLCENPQPKPINENTLIVHASTMLHSVPGQEERSWYSMCQEKPHSYGLCDNPQPKPITENTLIVHLQQAYTMLHSVPGQEDNLLSSCYSVCPEKQNSNDRPQPENTLVMPISDGSNALVHGVPGQEDSPSSSCYSVCQEKLSLNILHDSPQPENTLVVPTSDANYAMVHSVPGQEEDSPSSSCYSVCQEKQSLNVLYNNPEPNESNTLVVPASNANNVMVQSVAGQEGSPSTCRFMVTQKYYRILQNLCMASIWTNGSIFTNDHPYANKTR